MRYLFVILLALAGCGGAAGPCDDGRDYCGTPSTMICCSSGWHCGGPADECCVPDCYPDSCDRYGVRK